MGLVSITKNERELAHALMKLRNILHGAPVSKWRFTQYLREADKVLVKHPLHSASVGWKGCHPDHYDDLAEKLYPLLCQASFDNFLAEQDAKRERRKVRRSKDDT